MKLALVTLIVLLAAQFGAAQDTKLYVVTQVDLTPPYIADGTPLLLKFAADSRKEKGAVRFELLQEPGGRTISRSSAFGKTKRPSMPILGPTTPNSFGKSYNRCWEVR
jgi:hypothetical protein